MGHQYSFAVLLHPDPVEGGYGVTVPALPGCVSQGETIEDAIKNVKEAISFHLQGMIDDGEEIPNEDDHPQLVVITIPA